MSSKRRGSYPHPVLDNSDDVLSTFEVKHFTVSPDVEDVELKFQIRCNDSTLRDLVAGGDARYLLRWKCTATFGSGEVPLTVETAYVDGQAFVGWLDQRLVRGKVELEILVVATRDLPELRWERQNPEYGAASFALLAGDVLADAGRVVFDAEKLYDPLEPPVGSCFRFMKSEKRGKDLKVLFHAEDAVEVHFPEKLFRGFAQLGGRRDLQLSLVVLPALMATIERIRQVRDSDDSEDYESKTWYSVIGSLMDKHGGPDEDSFSVAQSILAHPFQTPLDPDTTEEDDE